MARQSRSTVNIVGEQKLMGFERENYKLHNEICIEVNR